MLTAQEISEIVAFYLPALIGAVSQLVFLALPIDLRNWRDDDINALTYVAIQLFMACVIFVGVPAYLDIFNLGIWRAIVILLVVFVLASIRAYRLVPLEFSSPVPASSEPSRRVDFLEFHSSMRLRSLAEISLNDRDSGARFLQIRERIAHRRPERSDRVLNS